MQGWAIVWRIWNWARWVVAALIIAFIAFFIWAVQLDLNKRGSDAAVVAIHAQKLTLADVMGDNLPPEPDPAQKDATVAGIDANNNGIRDDVELAIFKEYPSSAKIRAAELQYAMTEQMYLTKVFDTETWKAVAEEDGRANVCMFEFANALEKESEVESLIFNIPSRIQAQNTAFNFITSHGTATGDPCDVNLTGLQD